MTQRRVFIRSLLGDIFFFGLAHSLICIGRYLPGGERITAISVLSLAVPFFLMVVSRRVVKSFILFAAVHIALVTLPLWLPIFLPLSMAERSLLLIALVAFLIYSFIVRLKGALVLETGTAMFGAGALIITDVLLARLGNRELAALHLSWAFVFLLGNLLHDQILSVDSSMDILSGAAHQPIPSILRFNNALIAVFAVFVGGAAYLSGFMPLGRILGTAGNILLEGLVWLLRLIPGREYAPEFEGPGPASAPPVQAPPEFPDDVREPPAWLMLLGEIFYYAVITAIAAGFLLLLLYSIFRLYRRFHTTRTQDGDVREYIGPVPEARQIFGFIKKIRLRVYDAEQNRVRRRYARKVRRNIRKGVQVALSDTTGEIYAKLPKQDGMAELTREYNFVRYGRAEHGPG
ncbi:MAG: hypothetical protein FWH02_08560 [Oscillospiraceae bacterium]|nr:hypothetical protein [Oscillospiraceae bacterium]